MKKVSWIFTIFLFLNMLTGCALNSSNTMSQVDKSFYLDQAFETSTPLQEEAALFRVSPEMEHYVKTRLKPISNYRKRTERLLADLFDPDQIGIEYRHNANLTAAQTFDQGVANCLSLTLLSYVLIREAGLTAEFHDVKVEENWSQQEGISLINGHVNLRVFEPVETHDVLFFRRILTIDFLPMLNAKYKTSKKLTKQQITGLYYNNKGAEAFVNEDRNLAFQYFKKASMMAPKLSGAWSNLGSLYRQSGFLKEAEKVYEMGIQQDPRNLNIKENLALLYRLTNRQEQSTVIERQLRIKRKDNPYYHAMLGDELYQQGLYKASLKKYRLAASMNSKEHQFVFGIAKNYFMLDNLYTANRYLKKAEDLALSAKEKQQYQSKISAINQLTAKRLF